MNSHLPSAQPNTNINLIADIGGTNIRLAQATAKPSADAIKTTIPKTTISDIETYQCKSFVSLAEVVAHYIDVKNLSGFIIKACFAIACPTDKRLN